VVAATEISTLPITRPRAPTTIQETGLTIGILVPLALKALYTSSNLSESAIADQLGLSLNVCSELVRFMAKEQLCEVTGGESDVIGSSRYTLTGKGRERAADALSASGYVGKAPVPAAEYFAQVQKQSVHDVDFDRDAIEQALAHLVLPQETRGLIGQALSSKRSFLLYGASGNGKTSAALALRDAMPGHVIVPYAIEFMSEIIQVFDTSAHEPVETEAGAGRRDESGTLLDQRWIVIKRPAVFVAGDLAAGQLELILDEVHKTYDAPVQMKANGGILIIDDFGRQQLDAAYLLNRWVTPLERKIDYLSIHTGARLEVPFDVVPLFVTNRSPEELADEAFLRRIRYKIEIPSPDATHYVEIMRRECAARDVEFHEAEAGAIIETIYGDGSRAMRGCHPRDLVEAIADASDYNGAPRALTRATATEAASHYFAESA